MLKGTAVVTAQDMARMERLACKEGSSEQRFMENAGNSIAAITEAFVEENYLPRKVSLAAGKGNNGGDAFAAGIALLDKGFSVSAWHIYPAQECSSLCQQMRKRFEKKGGKVHTSLPPEGIILDGLVGTGFKGKAEGILARAIERVNGARLPVLSIDIPSGVDGTTGTVESVAVRALATIYLEYPKMGFFIEQGWDHAGKLLKGTFGLPEKYVASVQPAAILLNTEDLGALLPPIKRTRHKYEAGYVLGIAGSKEMPGAAVLSSYSSLLAGAGITRLFHPKHMDAALSAAPFELIKEEWNGKSLKRIKEESARAKALFIGPGMGRSKSVDMSIGAILKSTTLPTVIDADALFFLSQHPKTVLPQKSILTPHHGEMRMLLSSFSTQAKDPIQAYVDHKKTTLVLKGAPTFIYHDSELPIIVARGDPGMATAGAGDVLTGMIAAMLAQGLPPQKAACVAVALHAIAGETAALHLTSYCVTASKIMEYISDAYFSVVEDLL